MRRFIIPVTVLATTLIGCGGGGGDAQPAADLPEACVENGPLQVTSDQFPQFASGTFTPSKTVVTQTRVLPGEDVANMPKDDLHALADEKGFAAYRVNIANFDLDPQEFWYFLSTPTLPNDDSLYIGMGLYPLTTAGLKAGDVLDYQKNPEYSADMITTTGSSIAIYIESNIDNLYVGGYTDAYTGTAEVLYIDETHLCVKWDVTMPLLPPDGSTDKTISIKGVTSGPVKEANPDDVIG